MANNNGDIPCYKDIHNIIHITISGTKCLCGHPWQYGTIDREGKSNNILFRNFESVNCSKCKALYEEQRKS